jgi:hypothetical protein
MHSGPIIRSTFRLPPAGTPAGDQRRDEFVHSLLGLALDTRYLWLPKTGDTTTNTSMDRNARTTTYAASVAALTVPRGSGLGLTFDASAPVATTPDTANLSFEADVAFSLYAWLSVDATASLKEIISKQDYTTGAAKREWRWYIDSDEKVNVQLWDQSANARIGRGYATALDIDTDQFLVATYDGTTNESGITLYRNGIQIDDASAGGGSYTAMEDLAGLVRIGATEGTDGNADTVFDGVLYCVGVVAEELTINKIWAMKAAGNAFFDLAL